VYTPDCIVDLAGSDAGFDEVEGGLMQAARTTEQLSIESNGLAFMRQS
jgi:hypothetical protein